MSLLRQIRDAAIATDQPLTAVLRRMLVLAVRLDSQLLRQWAHDELNGYPEAAALPPYRQSRPVAVMGKFLVYRQADEVVWDPTDSATRRTARSRATRRHPSVDAVDAAADNVPIAADEVSPSDRSRLFRHRFLQPVAVYEDWLRTQPGDLTAPWPPTDVARWRDRLMDGAQCLAAWRVLPRADLIGVVDGVRNRLVELALDLEHEAPDAGDLPASQLPISGEQVTNIISTIIYAEATTVNDYSTHVKGSAGNIVGGQGNRVRQGDVSITQQRMELSELLTTLRTAVEQLGGRLSPEQLDAAEGLLEDLEEEAAAPQPARQRMLRALKGITVIAGAAGVAGAAVIDAAQAIHRALGG